MKRLFAIALVSLFTFTSCNNGSDTDAKSGAADSPAIEVTAVKLLADYEQDEPAAEKIYGGRNLVITGAIMSINTKHDGKVEILLNSNESSIGSVRCHFDVENAKALVGLQRGDSIVVKGVCANMDSHVQVVIKNAVLVPATDSPNSQSVEQAQSSSQSQSPATTPITRVKPSAIDRKVISEITDLEEPVESFLASNGIIYVVVIDDGKPLDAFLDKARAIVEKHKSTVRWIKVIDWNTEDPTNATEPFGKVVSERKW